jgi:GNAT superfamily N-acetyltransferase
MSLYADYLSESFGRNIIEREYGFITYDLIDDKICTVDGYIKPEFRNQGLASKMMDEIVEIGKLNNKKFLCCPVNSLIKTANVSHACHKAYGMKLYKIDVNNVIYIKEI